MTQQLCRLAAKAFAENHIEALSADLRLWRTSKLGLPATSQFHELAKLCAVYTSEGDEYQEAEGLVVNMALEAVARIEMLRTKAGTYESLLNRLHPHVRGCDSRLWDEYHAAIKS